MFVSTTAVATSLPVTSKQVRLAAEESIRGSSLDWTIVRPPRLTNEPATGAYRTAIDQNLPRGLTVSRADLAAYLLAIIGDPATIHHHVGIAR